MNTGLFSNEELVKMYRESGNERFLQELITQNVGIMNKWAVSYASSIPNAEVEDLVSEEYFPLRKAINDYEESKGVSFASFLKVYVSQHFNRLYNKETRQKRFTGIAPDSYEGLLEKASEDGYGSLGTSFTVECNDYSSIEFIDFLNSLELNEKEQVVIQVLLEGGNKVDVAKTLSITSATTTYYIKRIREKFINAGYQYAI